MLKPPHCCAKQSTPAVPGWNVAELKNGHKLLRYEENRSKLCGPNPSMLSITLKYLGLNNQSLVSLNLDHMSANAFSSRGIHTQSRLIPSFMHNQKMSFALALHSGALEPPFRIKVTAWLSTCKRTYFLDN